MDEDRCECHTDYRPFVVYKAARQLRCGGGVLREGGTYRLLSFPETFGLNIPGEVEVLASFVMVVLSKDVGVT